MYPSIFSNVITGRDPEETAAHTAELGLRSVQFVPSEVSVGFGFDADAADYSKDFVRWARAYESNDVEICAVAGYLNLLHPVPELRSRNLDVFASYFPRMADLGTRLISTETGSLAMTSDWDDDPANRTQEAWDAFREVLSKLAKSAESADVVILIEPYVVNICHTPALGVKMMDEVGSDHIRLCMDPTNFFDSELAHPEKVRETMIAGFAAENGNFLLAHAKDVTPTAPGGLVPGLPGPGQGILDYPLYLELLAEAGYNGPLVIEHLTEQEVPEALRFVEDQISLHRDRHL